MDKGEAERVGSKAARESSSRDCAVKKKQEMTAFREHGGES